MIAFELVPINQRFTPGDYLKPPLTDRSIERAEIADQVAEFLARGGKINTVPHGASGQVTFIDGDTALDRKKRIKHAAARAKTHQQQSSLLYGGAAADYLGITPEELTTLNDRGLIPATVGKYGTRRRYHINDLEACKATLKE